MICTDFEYFAPVESRQVEPPAGSKSSPPDLSASVRSPRTPSHSPPPRITSSPRAPCGSNPRASSRPPSRHGDSPKAAPAAADVPGEGALGKISPHSVLSPEATPRHGVAAASSAGRSPGAHRRIFQLEESLREESSHREESERRIRDLSRRVDAIIDHTVVGTRSSPRGGDLTNSIALIDRLEKAEKQISSMQSCMRRLADHLTVASARAMHIEGDRAVDDICMGRLRRSPSRTQFLPNHQGRLLPFDLSS